MSLEQLNYVRINESDNLLDLVFSNLGDQCEVTDTGGFSLVDLDHQHPSLHICISVPLTLFNDYFTPFVKKNYSRGDYLGIFNYLRDYQYSNSEDVDVLVDDLTLAFRQAVDQFIPNKTIRPSGFPAWYSRELICKLRIKVRLHRKFKKAPYNLTFKDDFSKIRKLCKILLARDERNYHKRVESDLKCNPKFFWRFAKLQYKGTHELNIIDGGDAVPPELVPNKFAEHFHSIYNASNLSDTFNNSDNQSICSANLDLPKIEESDIIVAAKDLKSSFVSGIDGIPSFLVKSCIVPISAILCKIFNCSLQKGKFPNKWKVAVVVPVPKKGNVSSIKNYRPISLLCIFSKLFEKTIYKSIYFHVHNQISVHQHGFLTGRSTVTNLVSFLQFSATCVLRRQQCDVIYFDLSRAFDVVNHRLLLNKLSNNFGLSSKYIKFFHSYLTERFFQVKVGNSFSDLFDVPSGVPQGSNLGPLLFILFFDDIKNVLKNCYFDIFADDLKIGRHISCLSDSQLLQNDIDSIITWCSINGMKINVDKIVVMSFTRKFNTMFYNYVINDTSITRKFVHTDLGVTLDTKLNFNQHILNLTSKTKKTSSLVIWLTKNFKNPLSHSVLYNALVRSRLEYCSEIWGNLGLTDTNSIENVQKSFLRLLTFRKNGRSLPYDEARKVYNLTPLKSRRILKEICFIFKLLNNIIDCSYLLQRVNINIPRSVSRSPSFFYLTAENVAQTLVPLYRFMYTSNEYSDLDFSDSYQSFLRQLQELLFET